MGKLDLAELDKLDETRRHIISEVLRSLLYQIHLETREFLPTIPAFDEAVAGIGESLE